MNETKVYAGFRQISGVEFYKLVGPMNVYSIPQGRWSDVLGYVTHWKTPDGKVVGITDGSEVSTKIKSRYFWKESA